MEKALDLLNSTLLKESQKDVNDRLIYLSYKLQELLPDPSLGPMERIERLARVIPNSYHVCQFHRTARSKLTEIEDKLHSLVPDDNLNSEQKIDYLVNKINSLVPEKTDRICQKLQFIGDNRLRDNGSIPDKVWNINSLDLQNVVDKKRKDGLNPNDCTYIDESKYKGNIT
ncbi:TPA: hypothetical protein ACF39K_002439 [Vibrio parahaemolyticus]|uniref:hypothetical protein n=1 Tax=Vibrio parahaemolyticus TaxID=670 RepID=UPI0005B6E3D8|nr:hypothetical protein [Vibrio parahaemolyticus]ELB2803129.1 hypothetical protein [Vibrio alginolyticus]KIT32502.1 hypothetical protein H323_14825 [Vibrio parahaemolyticus VP766]EGQ7846472.1 hypothetical protein [Vibrio parahaemolyticus]EGR2772715.1 hypothetical protein [Vibrio parahaemolyticus]EGR2835172.1 hypothetical protein [Vibrio parahaemolyticus]